MQRHARAAHQTATCRGLRSLAGSALVSSADTILVSKLKLACIADAVCTRKIGAAYANEGKMPFLFSLTCDGVNK